ncbi:MAG: tetratricopeptide repeat protein [Bacteroidia bacterium]
MRKRLVRIGIVCILFLAVKLTSAQTDKLLLEEAEQALENKLLNESLSLCNQILQSNPNEAKAYLIKARCRLEQKLYPDAFIEVNKAISKQPCYAEAFAFKAELHFVIKDYKQSRKFYYQALACNDKEAVYYFNIGVLESKLYKWKSAIENFGKAMKLQVDYLDAFENRAYAYSMTGAYELAIADYDSILKREPKRDDIFIKRGMAMLGLKLFKDAIPVFSRAIKMNPQNPHAYYGRGRAQFELKRFSLALPDFDTAISLKPDFETAIFTHAVTLLEINPKENKIQACEEFKKSAQLGFGNSWDYIRKYCDD